MKEGWSGDDYLVLFDGSEIASATEQYGIDAALPGYTVIGIRGWDDFIVRDGDGLLFTIPTVPLDVQYLTRYQRSMATITLQVDLRLVGKIKWYVKPIVFGGDPQADDNVIWIDLEQHTQLVSWWNSQYLAFKRSEGTA